MCKSSLAFGIKANFDGTGLAPRSARILLQLADRLLILSSHIGFSRNHGLVFIKPGPLDANEVGDF